MPGGLIGAVTRLLSAPFTGLARRDPELDALLTRLDGRRVSVRIAPPDLLPVSLAFSPAGVRVEPDGDGADLALTLTPGAALRLLAGADFHDLRAEGVIRIHGDLDVAALLQQGLLRVRSHCRPGTELARLGERAGEDLERYLTAELDLIPDAREVAGFVDEVDQLRLRVDRVAARVHRLRDRSGGGA